MFPHRILPEEELEENSEASDLFNKKAKELLKVLAPTKEEKAIMSAPRGCLPLSSVRKKLNFDESFSFDAPSIGRQKCQLAEYEEQLDKLRRKNEFLEREVHSLNVQNEKLAGTIGEMRNKISNLKQQLSEANLEKVNTSRLDESILDRHEVEQICCSANKYMSWFNTAISQLRVADEILKQNGLLTRENKQKLIEAERIYPLNKDASDIAALASGSVLDFPGLQSLREEDQELICHETGNSKLRFSPILSSQPIHDTLGNTLLNTTINTSSVSSVDCETQERLSRLEQQNSLLVDKLKIASHRTQKTLVLEEEKRSLELKVSILETQLQESLKEVAQLRKINADNMYKEADGDMYRKALGHVDQLVKLEAECKQLEANLFKSNEQITEYLSKIHSLEEEISNQNSSIDNLNYQLSQANQRVYNSENNYQSLSCKYEQLQNEKEKLVLGQSQSRTTENVEDRQNQFNLPQQETDAGDTTQIFHMANNPLYQAHSALQEESRKRKASANLEEETDSKRSKDEDLQSLKKHLDKLEKEREAQQKIQDDTLQRLKRFRELTTFLTGYQLKVTDFDEGLVTVSSIYDPENKQFAFKVGAQNVDLLDLGYSASQSMSWDEQARYYISERSSVPGFLAKVTTILEEQRELEVVERTHMFSVLEE